MKKRKIIIGSIIIIVSLIAITAVCDIIVCMNASRKTYDDADSIPHRKVGLILGTSPISTWNGRRNYYFDHWIKAEADLYKAGKVDWFVVSGGDHVARGKRFKSYRCKRNTGAFTWSLVSGPQFHYRDYSSALDSAAQDGGMGFAQEMMIHNGNAVKTTRPLGNRNVFRALCLNSDNQLALYEIQGVVTFGNFIDALLSVGVKEVL